MVGVCEVDVGIPLLVTHLKEEIEKSERELSLVLRMFSAFESEWNQRFKATTDTEKQTKLILERDRFGRSLEIETRIDRIKWLKTSIWLLEELIAISISGADLEHVVARIREFFALSAEDRLSNMETWWLARCLMRWVRFECRHKMELQMIGAWQQLELWHQTGPRMCLL